MRINKRAIETLDGQPKPSKRQTFWDDKLAGFGVRRSVAGRISYVVKYRIRGEAGQKFDTLGTWPAMLPDDARAEASDRISAAAQRRDLEAERAAEAEALRRAAVEASRRAIPLTEFLDGWRTTLAADLAKRLEAEQLGSTERELLRLERSVLRPFIGAATVGSFDPSTWQDLLDRQSSRSTAGNLRSAVVRFSNHVMAEMKARGLPVTWPTSFKLKGKIGQRYERYTLAEAARIWIVAGELGRRGALIRFMLLTASRRSEAARVRRRRLFLAEPDLPPYWLHLGGTTKNRREHRAPLSDPAVELVNWLPDRSTRTTPESDLLFSGRGGKAVSSWSDLASVLRERAGLPRGTFHDFRRTIVSALGDRGFDPVTTDKLLNHSAAATMPGVMAVYQQSEMLRSRHRAVQAWAEMLFAEVDRLLVATGAQPVSRETWGFEQPFEDAIVRRVKKEKPRPEVQAARRRRGRPPAAERAISSASQASSAVTA